MAKVENVESGMPAETARYHAFVHEEGRQRPPFDQRMPLLREAMAALQTLAAVDFSHCGMGPAGVAELLKFIPSMVALTELDVRWNKALDEAALAELRAAAPKTCKILTD